LASRVSARKPVRDAMTRYQRQLGEASPSVLEGRDIGTVVFPDAFVKVWYWVVSLPVTGPGDPLPMSRPSINSRICGSRPATDCKCSCRRA
jgi:hypothetical protein